MSDLFRSCFTCTKRRDSQNEVTFDRLEAFIKQVAPTPEIPKKPPEKPASPVKPASPAKLASPAKAASPVKSRRTEQIPREKRVRGHREVIRGVKTKSIIPEGPPVYPDKFVGAPEVFGMPGSLFQRFGLQGDLFYSYLGDKDAVMVFFYDPAKQASEVAKVNLREAAKSTFRIGHGFAAVNCADFPNICDTEEVMSIPSYKMYSYGKMVGQYDDTTTAEELQRFVESSPVAPDPPRLAPLACYSP